MSLIKDKTFVIIALCVGAFALALLSRFYLTGNFVNVMNVARIAGRAALQETAGRENFWQQEVGAPIDDAMQGPYSYRGIEGSDPNSGQVGEDGTKPEDDINIFQYQESKFTPECCTTSSTSISNDSGCLCMTNQQEKELAYRGGNKKSS
jgi:hypothetical protein